MNRLSEREHQIAQLVARGVSNRSIALGLRLSEQTVKNHISSIFHKMHVSNRVQLALRVVEDQHGKAS